MVRPSKRVGVGLAGGAPDDAAIVFLLVVAVDVVDVEAGNGDVAGGAEVVEPDVSAAADGGRLRRGW